jgi:hypothetical protein
MSEGRAREGREMQQQQVQRRTGTEEILGGGGAEKDGPDRQTSRGKDRDEDRGRGRDRYNERDTQQPSKQLSHVTKCEVHNTHLSADNLMQEPNALNLTTRWVC